MCSRLLLVLLTAAASVSAQDICNLTSVPSAIRNQLRTDFSRWKVQEVASLSTYLLDRWKSEQPAQCPGYVVGQFFNNKERAYGFLLVPTDPTAKGFRFVVFRRKTTESNYEQTVLAQTDNAEPGDYFIRSIQIAKEFSQRSRREFQMEASDGIFLVDSGRDEYGVNVYFWTGSRFRSDPQDR